MAPWLQRVPPFQTHIATIDPAEPPATGVLLLRMPRSLYSTWMTPRKKGIRNPPPLRTWKANSAKWPEKVRCEHDAGANEGQSAPQVPTRGGISCAPEPDAH
jgi:hypothetical protein